MKCKAAIIMLFFLLTGTHAQNNAVHRNIKPDERFKVDVMLIVAHPDDETAIGSYLAKLIYDENRKVAIIYTNRGEGGGNSKGNEQSSAMGAIREVEARSGVAKFGIFDVWFLDGYDTPAQDVFHSLKNLNHGAALEKIVRLIRLTRPEVILTWMPNIVAGENHGDHQASGVVATEAFDMAGSPVAFPSQVAAPRERADINNFNEGLMPWQPKKIYYFSDADEEIIAPGPKFDISEVSSSRKVPYYQIAAELHKPHLTQGDVSDMAIRAQNTGDYSEFAKYLKRFHLIFGKSVVKANPDGDVFEGISPGAHGFVQSRGYQPENLQGVSVELGGAFAFYKEFWRAHNIENIGPLVKPSINIAAGSYFNFPVIIRNNTRDSVEVSLNAKLPQGWKVAGGEGRYFLSAGEAYPVQTILVASPEQTKQAQDVSWEATLNGTKVGTVTIKVILSEWTLPQF